MQSTEKRIREPIVEGIFYPSEKKNLEKMLDDFLDIVPPTDLGARIIISPHAGLRYSGRIAARAYLATKGFSPKKIVIAAPMHRETEDRVFFPESTHFKTPYGLINVDTDAIARMADSSTSIVIDDIPHLEEHANEVQLPFIAKLFPDVPIIPILSGSPSMAVVMSRIFEILVEEENDTLFIISSNMSGYQPPKDARNSADLLLECIKQLDIQKLKKLIEAGSITSCGAACILAALKLVEKKGLAYILGEGDSSEGNNDKKNLVLYAAVALTGGKG